MKKSKWVSRDGSVIIPISLEPSFKPTFNRVAPPKSKETPYRTRTQRVPSTTVVIHNTKVK